MRGFLAILLLCAALVHPVFHAHEQVSCAAGHGALPGVAPPALEGLPSTRVSPAVPVVVYLPAAAAGEIPARAPPSA